MSTSASSTRAVLVERLRKAVFSAATLIQNDEEVGEETGDFVESDLRIATEALAELARYDAIHGARR